MRVAERAPPSDGVFVLTRTDGLAAHEIRRARMLKDIVALLIPHLELRRLDRDRKDAEDFVRRYCEPVAFYEPTGPLLGVQYKTEDEIMRTVVAASEYNQLRAEIEERYPGEGMQELLLNGIGNARHIRSDAPGWDKARSHAALKH